MSGFCKVSRKKKVRKIIFGLDVNKNCVRKSNKKNTRENTRTFSILFSLEKGKVSLEKNVFLLIKLSNLLGRWSFYLILGY